MNCDINKLECAKKIYFPSKLYYIYLYNVLHEIRPVCYKTKKVLLKILSKMTPIGVE